MTRDLELELANEQIRSLAGRLLDTLETISDAFFTLDREWRFTYLNAAAERLLERPRAELLGRDIWAEFPQAVGSQSDVEYRKAMTEGIAAHFEQFYPPLGRWLEADAYPSREGIAVYFRDVTERRNHREALRESEERFRLLSSATADAIWDWNVVTEALWWSGGLTTLFGFAPDEIEPTIESWTTRLHPDDRDAVEASIFAAIDGGAAAWSSEYRFRCRDGTYALVVDRGNIIRDTTGKAVRMVGGMTDVTARRKMEAQLLRAQRMDSIGALAGGIAHDLNNALAPIMITVSALRENEPDPSRGEDLATIQFCAQRAADMVRQLLSFARGSEGQPARTDLGKIAAEVHRIVRDTFPKDIVGKLSVAHDLWQVNADPTQLHQLLTNLCVNARDAMPDGGTLTIAIEHVVLDEDCARVNLEAKPGPYVVLGVDDTGTGMAPEVIDRIFDPFFTTKEIGKGTGLGLSTAHSIVRKHHGFIHVYSELGKGTRFEVYLPADVSAPTSTAVAAEPLDLPRGNGELVLVVDDEDAIREVARRTLERYGYRVMLASNGAEAVALYAPHRDDIAVVITDMAMPVMDGPATIAAVRALNAKARIIGSSGLNSSLATTGAGADHFMPKPYTADTILKALRKILTEPR